MNEAVFCIGAIKGVDLATIANTRMSLTNSNKEFAISSILVVANGNIGTIIDSAHIAIARDVDPSATVTLVNYVGPTQLAGGMSTGGFQHIIATTGWLSYLPAQSDVYFRVTTAANMGAGACVADIYVYGFYINAT